MYSLSVPLRFAEDAKKQILSRGIYDKDRRPKKQKDALIFPILKKDDSLLMIEGARFSKAILEPVKQTDHHAIAKVPDALKGFLPTSYDILGDIILIDISPEVDRYAKEIGAALLETHKSISTILKRSGQHSGEFRTQAYECIAGVDKRETIYKENNISLKLDVEKVYFSPRLSTERKRIYEMVKPHENVLVMFSGCGPYPIAISRNTAADRIIGIEKNPVAHKYAIQNLILNKTSNVELLCGDVRDIVPGLNCRFDRIVMPLPKDADTFLDVAFKAAKKGTVIHLYDFEHESEMTLAEKKVETACRTHKLKYEIINIVKCGQYSPGKFRVCVDFRIK